MFLHVGLLLGCGQSDEPPRDWLHSACRSESWDADPNQIWRTRVIEGDAFAVGRDTLAWVSAEGVLHYTAPMPVVEDLFFFEGALWASNWGEELAVCEAEGWRSVDSPVALRESSDQAFPLALEQGLAMLEINYQGDGCEGDCNPSRTLHSLVDGDWESEPLYNTGDWALWEETLLLRVDGTWLAQEDEGLVDGGLAMASTVIAMPKQDWGITQTESGWTHGPRGDQTPLELPEHNGAWNGAHRRLQISAPGHYILGDAAQGWEYKDGAWTELSFVTGSRPGSGVALDDGILMLSPLQWITPDSSVEIPLVQ